ncbi:MAG: hypothetical protein PHN31_00765 [Candidatus Gracilibacteria bacterium]|nr:hypothetical protein [Candidatus Gracilibacteria bacterium]
MIKKIFRKKQKVNKAIIVLSDVKFIIITLCIIMIWRGFWNFLDHYFFQQYFVLSNALSMILGILIIAIFKVFDDKKEVSFKG